MSRFLNGFVKKISVKTQTAIKNKIEGSSSITATSVYRKTPNSPKGLGVFQQAGAAPKGAAFYLP